MKDRRECWKRLSGENINEEDCRKKTAETIYMEMEFSHLMAEENAQKCRREIMKNYRKWKFNCIAIN